MLQINMYKQTDSRWAFHSLGSTTIGKDGCLMTCVVNWLKAVGIDTTPDKLVEAVEKVGGIADDGNFMSYLLWKVYPDTYLLDRYQTANDKDSYIQHYTTEKALAHIKRLLSMGLPVIVHVDAVAADGHPDHFVLVHDYLDGTNINCFDPYYGAINFKAKYGDPAKSVYGICAMLGTPVSSIDNGANQNGAAVGKMIKLFRGLKNDPTNRQIAKEAIEVMCGA